MVKAKKSNRGGKTDTNKYKNPLPYYEHQWKEDHPTHTFKNVGLQQSGGGKTIGLTFDKPIHILKGDESLELYCKWMKDELGPLYAKIDTMKVGDDDDKNEKCGLEKKRTVLNELTTGTARIKIGGVDAIVSMEKGFDRPTG